MVPPELPEPLPDAEQAFSWLIVGIFAAWSGIVRYLIDQKTSGHPLSLTDVLAQIVISAFTGFIGGLYGYEQGYSDFMTMIFSALGGFFGGQLLEWLWSRFFNT